MSTLSMIGQSVIEMPTVAPVNQEPNDVPAALLPPLRAVMGAGWVAAYILLIRRGFIDKFLGMPLPALGFNIAWEFSFAFLLPHPPAMKVVDITWFFIDLVILWQAFKFGRRDYPWLSPRAFSLAIIGMLVFAELFTLAVSYEFADEQGAYTAYFAVTFMSFMFIVMLLRRGSTVGQSLPIAVAKWIGSIPSSILFLFWYPERWLLTLLAVTTFVLDVLYIGLLYSYRRREVAASARDAELSALATR